VNVLVTGGAGYIGSHAVRELRDGRVIVSDLLAKGVSLVDFRTGSATAIGREGQGPGEFAFPTGLVPLPGDTTLLVDPGQRRFLKIAPDGKPVGTVPFPEGLNGIVTVRGAELFLFGANIAPLPTVSTHFIPDPMRTRKLLMRAEEIRRLIGKVEQRGYTLVPLNLHYSKGRIKLEVGLGRGKLQHDKRADKREKEWNREKQRLLRSR